MTTTQENHLFEEEQVWRANIYGLLATCLANPPDESILSKLTELKNHNDDVKTEIEIALSNLAQCASELDVVAISDEFQILFIGISQGEVVPYGSWYLSGFVMDKPLAELRSSLTELGYERQEGVCESEDHIAGVCDVMRGLITEPGIDLNTSLTIQRKFYYDHISNWVSRFFQDLQVAENANFYRFLAILGINFIVLEDKYLTMDG